MMEGNFKQKAMECVTATVRQPEVTIACNEVNDALDSLAQAVGQLRVKLMPVSRGDNGIVKETAPQQGGTCQLAQTLFEFRDRIHDLTGSLKDQYTLLEI